MGITHFDFSPVPEIEGLQVITPFIADDDRGEFRKLFEHKLFKEHGIDFEVSEFDESVSRKGVVRGLHMQHTKPQKKLVSVAHGRVYDVAVDGRKGSPTYGKYFGIHLTAENRKMLYIPEGFFHGFVALEDNTVFCYLCANDYCKEYDGGIFWQDPDVNVKWPLDEIEEVIMTEKDKALPTLQEYASKYEW